MKIIGVDVGGTKISSGLIVDGKIIIQETIPTPFDQPKMDVVGAIIEAITKVYDSEVVGIGIGVPGLVDLKKGLVIDVTNIPSWDEVPLQEAVSNHFGIPAYVNNDANCFVVGEKYFGKGKPYNNFVGIVFGTGVGAGIMINGHLYSGRFCGAGEFGNIYYKEGTVEAYSCGQFFKDKGLNGLLMAEKARQGDLEAIKLFDELGLHIGKAIANVLFALAPEAIILGGSVSQSYDLFQKSMHHYFQTEFPFQRLYKQLKIEISDLENMAILGASSLVLDAI